MEEIPPEDNYDSDSSLTQAANRSLDLSRSLGDRCAEITQGESSDEEEVELNDRQEINQASKEEEREEMVEDENKVADMEPVHIVDVSKYSNFDIKKILQCHTLWNISIERKFFTKATISIQLQASPSSGSSASSFKRPLSPKKTPPHERNTKDCKYLQKILPLITLVKC